MIIDDNKQFLDQYVATRLPEKMFVDPDLSLIETRNERWPTRWEKKVQGQPSMEITSEERRSNYL